MIICKTFFFIDSITICVEKQVQIISDNLTNEFL